MTVNEYSEKHNLTIPEARRALERAVKNGTMTKRVYDEIVYRRVRGYSGKYMPCKTAHYYPTKGSDNAN